MRKVILADKEQLKCNFCTHWFTVSTDFARIQRYSLNACEKCFSNFRYQLINSQTYEIYHVLLFNTGFKLTSKKENLDEIYTNLLSEAYPESKKKIVKFDTQISSLQNEVDAHFQDIKEKFTELSQNLIQSISKNWEQMLEDYNSIDQLVEREKEKRVRILSSAQKDFKSIFNERNNLELIDKIRRKKQAILKINDNYLKKKIADCFEFKDSDKENFSNLNLGKRGQNSKTIKTLRQMITNNRGEEKSEKQSQNCQARKGFLFKSKRSLRSPSCKSSKSSSRTMTKYSESTDIQTQIVENRVDSCRQKIASLLKQKQEFETYLPETCQGLKPHEENIKFWGQKSMIERILELKLRTHVSNDQLEVINENFSGINFFCYLQSIEWYPSISIVKLVKTCLNDEFFNEFLHWMSEKQEIQTMVLTNNHLTEKSVRAIVNFVERHKPEKLTSIYLGNNWIKGARIRSQIQMLKEKNILIYL